MMSRKATNVRLSEEAYQAWSMLCDQHHVTLVALLDVVGPWLAGEAPDATLHRLVERAKAQVGKRYMSGSVRRQATIADKKQELEGY